MNEFSMLAAISLGVWGSISIIPILIFDIPLMRVGISESPYLSIFYAWLAGAFLAMGIIGYMKGISIGSIGLVSLLIKYRYVGYWAWLLTIGMKDETM